jgi:hypothetical protein
MSKLSRSQPACAPDLTAAAAPAPAALPPPNFPPPSPTSSPTVPAGVATSDNTMPWQLDGFVAERLEKCRHLLEAAEAAGGQGDDAAGQAQQADMRVWVEYADLIVALHRTALDERGRGRGTLSPGERVQVRAGSSCSLHACRCPTVQTLQLAGAPKTACCCPTGTLPCFHPACPLPAALRAVCAGHLQACARLPGR